MKNDSDKCYYQSGQTFLSIRFVLYLLTLYNNLKCWYIPMGQTIRLIKPSLTAIKKKKSLYCSIWPKGLNWHWLLICLTPLSSVGQKSDFLDFLGEATLALMDKTVKWVESSETNCSEKQFKRMWPLSGQYPPASQNKRRSATRGSSKGLHKWGDFSRSRWSQLCQTSKSNHTQEILKWGSYTGAVIFKSSRLLAKGKLMSLAMVFCLNKGNITFSGI
jgi:hypothetical protein